MKHAGPDPDCEFCGGTGEVETMERVYPGEPIMAPIGTARCSCTITNDDDNEDEESQDVGESDRGDDA